MAYFIRRGDTYWPHSASSLPVSSALPAGNYVVRKDEHGQIYLQEVAPFELPERLYGDILQHGRKIMQTFHDRPKTTGVLLAGEKGSGKTLLSKHICVELAAQNVPTILVNQPFCGDVFNTFIQTIEQPAIVLFDEFEKVYKREEQETLLTLLDGVISSKKLFLLTCNDPYRIDSHMRNRPGRIYYYIHFRGLKPEFIREYCQENLQAKEHIDKICTVADMFTEFNFDMLKALVEEMNRYNEPPQVALEMLNAKPEHDAGGRYAICLLYRGKEYKGAELYDPIHTGNPFSTIEVDIRRDADEDPPSPTIYFDSGDFVQYDAVSGVFVFKQDDKMLTLTKIREKTTNYFAF